MALANENYLKTPEVYCFDDIEKSINAYKILHPDKKLLRLGVGDVTRPLPDEVIAALHKAVDEMAHQDTFRGYSPPQGYDFLIEKTLKEYRSIGVSLEKESIFVNNGAKSDLGNIGHVLGRDNIIAIAAPVYPVYENATIMSGRAGNLNEEGEWSNIVYLHCSEANGFIPELPKERVDIIYLCNPSNPTGVAMDRTELKKWVDYAIENKSIIVYDGAYYSYVNNSDIPLSIYEIKGAKKVAIEVRSYSKIAGFTGLRCGYTVCPSELNAYTLTGESIPFINLWSRRNANYNNGVPYIVQRGAEAIYSRKGKKEVKELVDYYLNNAAFIRCELLRKGLKVFGGEHSPYVWFKIPDGQPSMKYFMHLLYTYAIAGTPGIVFGKAGEGYMRFTGFGSSEDTKEALRRLEM
ncbi:LL-diaminopimelate aminotransferase [Paludibacter sp. 221]|uniref:LL-diaminopimelate aminotransferase n=1 Tax=Paludibacter sp. 221 TaxID=2302939 RepID=UPI0013D01A95|nr:LL-diaminopimelate aminotransferase [Paludibacter sp. 221]NDV47235.1 LL-diaminopimelate aminotransferase [Paludibacter sp. 221]